MHSLEREDKTFSEVTEKEKRKSVVTGEGYESRDVKMRQTGKCFFFLNERKSGRQIKQKIQVSGYWKEWDLDT